MPLEYASNNCDDCSIQNIVGNKTHFLFILFGRESKMIEQIIFIYSFFLECKTISEKVAANGNRSFCSYFHRSIHFGYQKIFFYHQKSTQMNMSVRACVFVCGMLWRCTNTSCVHGVWRCVTIAYLICHILISANTISSSHLKSIQFNAVRIFVCKNSRPLYNGHAQKFSMTRK